MKLVKYQRPFGALDTLFDSLNGGFFPAFSSSVDDSEEPNLRLPRTNIEETDDSYVITMEMPGLSRKDIEVSLENDKLSVKGERVEKSEEEGRKASFAAKSALPASSAASCSARKWIRTTSRRR